MRIKLNIAAALLLSFLLLLPGCGRPKNTQSGGLSVVATTYPVFCFAEAALEGVGGVTLSLMVDQPISCIHDYTLTVSDMTLLDGCDLLLMSGAELENFLSDALGASPDIPVCDASAGIALRETADGENDPHIWMDPRNAAVMTQNIAEALAGALPDAEKTIAANAKIYEQQLSDLYAEMSKDLANLPIRGIITFHDGFAYFSGAFGLELLCAIEEEAGSEASARDIEKVVSLVRENTLPAVFCEKNGATATAEAVSRETGCSVGTLDMIISGSGGYIAAMRRNAEAIAAAYSE